MTDDNVRVLDTLRARGYDAREAEVLVTETIAQDQCLVVFATANNDRAMVVLNASTSAA